VARLVGHLARDAAQLGDVVQQHDGAAHVAALAVQRVRP
jgi:hypothetical protein